jgi:DNA processing protein
VSRRLGRALGSAGVTVVSGLALGVDGAAHAGALEVDGDTVAVMGRGADRAYPRSHTRLFRQVVEKGLVVSEFLPGTGAHPHHFPRRNRILAALARAVVVVEAGRKSGSLITVDHALPLGLDVYSVPGPIDTRTCLGSNRLLVDGARPLVSVDEFVAEVAPAAGDPARPDSVPLPLIGPEADVLQALEAGPCDVDRVSRETGLSPSRALGVLTRLELDGLARRLPGQRFRRAG